MPTLPRIIKFAFNKYDVKDGKHKAECNICKAVIREKTGTTSGFVRHFKNQHKPQFSQYLKSDPKVIATNERDNSIIRMLNIDHNGTLMNCQDIEVNGANRTNNHDVHVHKKRIVNSTFKDPSNVEESGNISIGSYFKQKSPHFASQIAMEDEDDLFLKLLTIEIKKITEPSMKRRLKRQILEAVYSIQDEHEASRHHQNANVLRVLSDNGGYQNLVLETKAEEFTD